MVWYTPEEWLGTATISPDGPILAGSYGTWTIHYTVGVAGLDEGGRLRLVWRSVSDWPNPQFDNPLAENYVTLRTSGHSKLFAWYEGSGVRPWSRVLKVQVGDVAAAPGDEIVIVLGDRRYGGPGMRAQTHPEDPFTFQFDADPIATNIYERVADFDLQIIGAQAVRLYCVAPSDAVKGEQTWLQVRALDRWGNPDPGYRGTVSFSGVELDDYTFTSADAGVRRFEGVELDGDDLLRVAVSDVATGWQATSNPIRLHSAAPAQRTYWADLHGQTRETVGTGTVPGYFTYARDVAAIDACGHQGNDFQITPELWSFLQEQVDEFYEPGRFVTLHGYEWSGNTPAGGDHNVYYKDRSPIQRSSHAEVEDTSDIETDCYPITRLYDANRGREDMLLIPHIGGRHADIRWHEPSLEPVIEIASQWGRFEWFARQAIERGYKVGFSGGSDDHSARPGWSSPTLAHHGVSGGLTGFIAPELTRDALWDVLKSRRLYGTSGPRILVDVSVDGHLVGAENIASAAPEIQVNVHGTAGLERIELRRGLENIHVWSGLPEPKMDEPWRVRLAWRGARNFGRSRALCWDGDVYVWDGVVTHAENYAIDNPDGGVISIDPSRVSWRSWTVGDWDGVILDIDGDERTRLDVRTTAMNLSFRLGDLTGQPIIQDGSLLEQQFTARRLSHDPAPFDASFSWRDESPVEGVNPYWIWVTQTDGELAWSSPIYLTVPE